MRRSNRVESESRTVAATPFAVVAIAFAALTMAGARQNAAPAVAKAATPAAQDWLVWGGPNRDFKSSSSGLSGSWPSGGPRKLWSRALGEGYSGIAVEGKRIYTAYNGDRSSIVGALLGRRMVVTALDANTGQTIWEHTYNSSFSNAGAELGDGPYAMPQVVGGRLVSVDGAAFMYSLDKQTGVPAWSHDLQS